MNPTDIIRAQMCLGRPDLLQHKKCKEFLTQRCKTQTTGAGYCKKWKQIVTKKCKEGTPDTCEYAVELGGLSQEEADRYSKKAKPEGKEEDNWFDFDDDF